MNGPLPLEDLAAIRADVMLGNMLGPHFVTPGPLIDGPGRSPADLGANVRAVSSAGEARAAVRRRWTSLPA